MSASPPARFVLETGRYGSTLLARKIAQQPGVAYQSLPERASS